MLELSYDFRKYIETQNNTVHLSQRKSAMLDNNSQIVAWKHDEKDPDKYVIIEPPLETVDIYGKEENH